MKASEKYSLEYFRIHNWLSYHHKKMDNCEFCGGSENRLEWALKKGCTHQRDRSLYLILCAPCHRKYDYTDAQRNKVSKARKGIPAKNKRAVVLNGRIVFNSITEASKKTGILPGAIHNNIKGISFKTKKGKWEYLQVN